ncbi:hypothetical protein EWM64_g171 [Hericium alpestre]|uniref:Elongator complex protein 2 n=1 Tax=Hericium alpestre TaxID=135208 RepID=A0A4Z0AB85_9AGAM|nr:hypothetical protein EWM64_g171 [Hericium alpestre]
MAVPTAHPTVTTEYIAAATNRTNHAASISPTFSLVAYGSGKLIALWDTTDPADRGVLQTLPGHTGLVTCVRFMNEERLISTDDIGANQWTSVRTLQAHRKAISALAVHPETRRVVTGASDATVKVWDFDGEDGLTEVEVVSLKNRYPLSIEVATLPETRALILAIGSTDHSVHIYTRSDNAFVHSVTLSGHEDWVRSLAFRPASVSFPLVLASGSQDTTIRLWNIEEIPQAKSPRNEASTTLSDELLDAFEASLADAGEGAEGGRQISLKKHVFTARGPDGSPQQFSITFDALLIGHEAGVTSLSWRPSVSLTPTLLSTSTDSSLILWSPSALAVPSSSSADSTSIWINRQRFGDIGGQRLGGFVGGLWAGAGTKSRSPPAEDRLSGTDGDEEVWMEVGAVSGHAGPVKGIAWAPGGEYLISTGLDQTARIHGAIPGQTAAAWHELSRPQVHGYDLLDVVSLDAFRFASIADEKVVRVFEAPRAFVATLRELGVANLGTKEDEEKRPVSTSVPPLGLSNKAASGADENAESFAFVNKSAGVIRRPFEGELAAMTLWPEVEKVFGHGYESVTIGVSSSRKLFATACKSSTPKHAVVRIYDSAQFQPFGEPLEGHVLTVTRIAFSPDDKRVLTVSRDRTWRLFELQAANGYVPVAADKSHGRIIWDCAWAPGGEAFATASRDKTVRIWRTKDEQKKQWTTSATIKLQEAATAIAFASAFKKNMLAIGLENGDVVIYTSPLDASDADWDLLLTINSK